MDSTPEGGHSTEKGRPAAIRDRPLTGLEPGQFIDGRYRIRRLIGSGGMADVYEAMDLELEEPLAIKILHPKIASRRDMVERFKQEIKLARRIVHSNVCRIYHFATSGRQKYVTMELLRGSTLGQVIAERDDLDLDARLALFREILAGLAAAHRTGIIHRDLKPQNVMVTEDGPVVIMDFGIAKELKAIELTTTGDAVGTPAYMAPETLLGSEGDQRTDIYSLGVMLFELATGRLPFTGATVFEIARNQISGEAPRLTDIDSGLPPWLEAMTLKMLAKRPDDRYPNVEQVLAELPERRRGTPRRTVLLVDDDPEFLRLLELQLQQAGLAVITAPGGGAGIEAALQQTPDLVCLDFNMPEMDGFQVATFLRQQAQTRRIPIFMMTAIRDPQYQRQAVRLGIEEFFTKPLDLERFTRTVSDRLAAA